MRVRLALAFKNIDLKSVALPFQEDEVFFELGVQRKVPVLVMPDGQVFQDSLQILWQIDELFPQSPPLVDERVDSDAWSALLQWRQVAEPYFQRLYAPLLLAYSDVAESQESIAEYKQQVQHALGVSVEMLANDRYSLYAQLESLSHLKSLSQLLARQGYYLSQPSIADCLLVADLYPLQLMDGINLPIDLLYYLQRIERESGLNMQQGLLHPM